jgi:hypothetical protein
MIDNLDLNSQWKARKCKHEETVPTAFPFDNGGFCVAMQCVVCGIAVAQIRENKSGYVVENLPLFDHVFREEQYQLRKKLYFFLEKQCKAWKARAKKREQADNSTSVDEITGGF